MTSAVRSNKLRFRLLAQEALHAVADLSHDARDDVVGQFGERMERGPLFTEAAGEHATGEQRVEVYVESQRCSATSNRQSSCDTSTMPQPARECGCSGGGCWPSSRANVDPAVARA